ncbi:hypothetical protein [Candidatus Contendibacter odensensis]|nr:hypothetical protein [Candidatus Contendobacter odensis]
MKQHTAILSTVMLSGIIIGCSSDPLHAQSYQYYPDYNPTVRRDYYSSEGYAPDGTYHSEDIVEDKRASYYSPGRNKAITRPRTTVESWRNEPGQQTTRERTSWIGADGKPHSTTIERNEITDPDGNSHTDTHVTLKRANKGKKDESE